MASETFGEYLKRERELRQISLEEVSEGTKIGINLLRAMEEDRWEDLPAEVFVRGFIKHFSEFIGLVPEEVMLRYQENRIGIDGTGPDEEGAHLSKPDPDAPGGRPVPVLVVVLLILIILGIGYWFFWRGEHPSDQLGTEPVPAEIVVPGETVSPPVETPADPGGPVSEDGEPGRNPDE